jgi:hypothetical protein
MRLWQVLAGSLIGVVLLSKQAQAFVEEPFVIPALPTADTPIWVHVTAGICHAISDGVDDAELVLVAPGQLQLLTEGVALPPAHPFCIYPPFPYRFNIGKLPVGRYTLEVFIHDDFSSPEPIGVGSVSFVVATPMSIPSTSTATLAVLAVASLALGALAARDSSRA